MPLGPHGKIGIGWAICTFGGLYSFYWAKTSIEKKRYDNMISRRRMRTANEGEYEPSSRRFAAKNY